jgi:outer membrane protein
MKKMIFLCLLTIGSWGAAVAQSGFTAFTYSMGFGTGDLGDYIGQASFRGATLDYRKFLQPAVGLGFDLGWNTFYEEMPYDTYTAGTISFSGKQYRYSNHVPILLAADYFFKPGEKLNPFAGLGIGTMYSRRNTDMNLYTLEQENWSFVLRPEAGIWYEVQPGFGLMAVAKYYTGFEAGELETQSYLAFNVGFVFSK